MVQPMNIKDPQANIPNYIILGVWKITSFKETNDGRFLIELKGMIDLKLQRNKNNKDYCECEVDY